MAHETVRIPPGLNDEDPFLILSNLKFSLRQMITVIGGVMVWFVVAQGVALVLGSSLFSYIIALPVLVLAIVMAFIRRDGKPIEVWFSDWLIFAVTPRRYSLRREVPAGGARSTDAWEDDDFVL